MNYIIENWYLFVALAAVVTAFITLAVTYFKMPTAKQIEAFKEWLKYAVTKAEKELKSGTGQLKLRMVYDMAISKYEWLAQFVSFGQFSKWVDEALEWLDEQLKSNENVKIMVKGE